jgi:ParB-like chromosome segregation protein Spo0J
MAKAKSPPRKPQPLDNVCWLKREEIVPNDYNPNKMPPPEFQLLKISILEDGWTQPIVVFEDDAGGRHIVDGEHRWQVSGDPEIAALSGGLVPVVFIKGDRAKRMMSTIRHNRARGEHGVLPMAEIVKALLDLGKKGDEIMFLLQMEDEEVERLAERAGMPIQVQRTHPNFNSGWVPGNE